MASFSLKLQFDVTFPAIPCSLLSLDAMDISGEQHLDIVYCSQFLTLLCLNWFKYYFAPFLRVLNLIFLKKFPFPLTDLLHAYDFTFQRHDIFKKRIDFHGNVLEVRQDGIGAPKVSGL